MAASHPSVYATDHSAPVLRTHSWRTAANSCAYLIPHVRPGFTVLDVGCGPGSITLDLARLVPDGHVTGLENVPEPLHAARALATEQAVSNVSFCLGDIHALPFDNDCFDVVHAHQVLQHVADPVAALREMRRVARSDGGIVACRESAAMTWFPASEPLEAWRRLTTAIAAHKGGNPHPGARIHVWAQQAGFSRDRILKSTDSWCFSSDSEREYWGGSMAQRARAPAFVNMALDHGHSTPHELHLIAAGWDAFCRDADAWFGLLHGQILCRN
ncbi:hypothetical protein CDD82_4720 [Ophiocordyceps australis]|uniref:Methyltransferase domain-containing protein n=1 Tax=Ophiocordyceps australis TaxID=1399860 RepID=A0A2C5Z1N4_9HYPO|nr:hypothetical protein CDD82_4720 [Ophiocordyceps australis]